MSKLCKAYKRECKEIARTMLYATDYIGKVCNGPFTTKSMEFDFSNYFGSLPGLHITVHVVRGSTVSVAFFTDTEVIAASSIFTDKQLAKLDKLGSSALLFQYDEAPDKLYRMMKYLYKNA